MTKQLAVSGLERPTSGRAMRCHGAGRHGCARIQAKGRGRIHLNSFFAPFLLRNGDRHHDIDLL